MDGPPARGNGDVLTSIKRIVSGRGGDANSVHVEGDAGPHRGRLGWRRRPRPAGRGRGRQRLAVPQRRLREAPRLAGAEILVPPGEAAFGANVPKEPRRGIRSKVCAADWNGDGRLDLLVGDFATQAPDLPDPTPDQKAKQAALRKELEEVQRRYGEKVQKVFGPNRARTKEELDKVNKELKEIQGKMQELNAQLPAEYENHGWIWLFLRKPAEKAGAR